MGHDIPVRISNGSHLLFPGTLVTEWTYALPRHSSSTSTMFPLKSFKDVGNSNTCSCWDLEADVTTKDSGGSDETAMLNAARFLNTLVARFKLFMNYNRKHDTNRTDPYALDPLQPI